MTNIFILATGINGFLSVALGAFAAHALKNIIETDLLATFQTAVQYHITHSLALFGVAILTLYAPNSMALKISGSMFIAGILFFSGSLYILSITGIRWLGAITPIGGICFLVAWGCLCWFALSTRLAI
ncbi:MAG: uncharacterized membrane protein YgdD (TMEM256/DUF423 family) [Pseudohongiellaceae bacterium]|jgi:uncharacterized membrane protein YgdD (TMEM256/DUF423 family)